eukprot:CAMPEP_0113902156 /NCGR_PEP_ID=MMETSP0780_2-20120614/21685_1 /TAXON_ID=652834 /ORGANISM="Palpitomonas bilix" /LENGTH=1118 /DNA_ID=CAMNT_0000894913 /DNA_START=449 /DNA_END=3805 /DNA_ORIENTATION=- /assembly_acc=CAM_ASM_000599
MEKLSASLLLALVGIALLAGESEGQRLYGGKIEWTSNTTHVIFDMTTIWRRSDFQCIYSWVTCPFVTADGIFPLDEALWLPRSASNNAFYFGDGSAKQSVQLNLYKEDTTHDLIYAKSTLAHAYATAGPYTAGFSGCCRPSPAAQGWAVQAAQDGDVHSSHETRPVQPIPNPREDSGFMADAGPTAYNDLNNNGRQSFNLQTTVEINGTHGSPVTIDEPFFTVQPDAVERIPLYGYEPSYLGMDEVQVSYRLGEGTETGAGYEDAPDADAVNLNPVPQLVIDPVTSEIVFNTSGLQLGYWNVVVMMLRRHAGSHVKVPLDIAVKIFDAGCNDAPTMESEARGASLSRTGFFPINYTYDATFSITAREAYKYDSMSWSISYLYETSASGALFVDLFVDDFNPREFFFTANLLLEGVQPGQYPFCLQVTDDDSCHKIYNCPGFRQVPLSDIPQESFYDAELNEFASCSVVPAAETFPYFEEGRLSPAITRTTRQCVIAVVDYIYGCLDPDAYTYDPLAHQPDPEKPCIYKGCMEPEADNYLVRNTIACEGCCNYTGCMDTQARNYLERNNVQCESCCEFIGCTNPAATNFWQKANVDSGLCTFITPNAQPQVTVPTPTKNSVLGICDYKDADPRTAGGERYYDLRVYARDENTNDTLDIYLYQISPSSEVGEVGNKNATVITAKFAAGLENTQDHQDLDYATANRFIRLIPTEAAFNQCVQVYRKFNVVVKDNSDSNPETSCFEPELECLPDTSSTYNLYTTVRKPPTLRFVGASNGQTLEADVGCEMSLIVEAFDCNEDEDLNVYVLEDPGLPNGAYVTQQSKVNEQRNVVRRSFNWSPRKSQMGQTYKVCFTAKDDNEDCEIGGWYAREPVCVFIHVKSLTLGISATSNSTLLTNGTVIKQAVGCTSVVTVVATEETGACVDVAFGGAVIGSSLTVTNSCSETCLEQRSATCPLQESVCSRSVTFSPQRGEEGSIRTVCVSPSLVFSSQSQKGGQITSAIDVPELCIHFEVVKCEYCVAEGDTLEFLASWYHLDMAWQRVWNSNPHIEDPDSVIPVDRIRVGPTYTVRGGDNLADVISMFKTTRSRIDNLNPDVAVVGEVQPGTELCVVPCSGEYTDE